MIPNITTVERSKKQGKYLLEVENLRVYFPTRAGVAKAVDGVNFHLASGETLGIVGESGCGKSVTALGILGLVPSPGKIDGKVIFEGQDLRELSESKMRKIRGGQISMILQDPMTSLNPVFTIGNQVAEASSIHHGLKGKTLLERVVEVLGQVRIPDARRRLADYPHQMSGGMRQRVCGAIGISCSPKILICDEPTTALDSTIQLQYLDLLKDVQQQTGVALIFITHDLGILARVCDQVMVMYAGRPVETGPTREVLRNPTHPYTLSLLKCLPRIERVERLDSIEGQPPIPTSFPPGCRFAPRCPKVQDICTKTYPEWTHISEGHDSACYFPGDWRDGK